MANRLYVSNSVSTTITLITLSIYRSTVTNSGIILIHHLNPITMNVYILNCDMFDNGTHVSNSIVNVFATKELAEKDRDHCIKFEDADNYMFDITYTITEIQVQGA